MPKNFYMSWRYGTLIAVAIPLFLVVLFGFFVSDGFFLLLAASPVFIFWIILGFYRISYKIIIKDNLLIESQLFRKNREINISDITNIKKSFFYVFGSTAKLLYGLKFENFKYKKFPRYPMANLGNDIFDEIVSKNPSVKVDPNCLEMFKYKGEMNNYAFYGVLVAILLSATVIYFIYFLD